MTMRWIWLVPSQIWVIVDRTAVSAGNGAQTDRVPARIQHRCLGGRCLWLSCWVITVTLTGHADLSR